MIRRAAMLALALAAGTSIAAAQSPTIELRDAGPGPGPSLLQQELSHPYVVVAPATTRFVLRRDSTVGGTLVVLGRDVYVDGRVQGDLVVIGGDLYMHPGGAVSGRAIAIGGGVYESTLASTGRVTAFRDFTYDIAPAASGYALSYRSFAARDSTTFAWTGIFGLHLPSYDRSNGLSVPFSPTYHVQNTGLTFAPSITYRSQLGRLDPGLDAVDSIGRRTALRLTAERGTSTNERWIYNDLVNSLDYLAAGSDVREYYGSTRVTAMASRRWESENGALAPYLGLQYESAEPVRPGPGAEGGPWVFFNRHDPDDALRPNPIFPHDRILSALAGASWNWLEDGVGAGADALIEAGAPTQRCGGCVAGPLSRFVQTTLDGRVQFPTFGSQSFRFHGHAVLTTVGNTPAPRWAFLGGPGTLPTLEPMSLGGDELLYFDFRYNLPLEVIQLPFIGPPTLTLRDAMGGAAFGKAPTLHQSIGARVSMSYLYSELMVDPIARRGHFGVGISTTP